MARSQTWTRNISKKMKSNSPREKVGMKGIVNDEPLERLKRRAEDIGLIMHARPDKKGKGGRK